MSESLAVKTQNEELETYDVEPEINGLVLKVNNLCPLDCYRKANGDSGCYMYAVDSSYKDRPSRMGLDVVRRAAERFAEYATRPKVGPQDKYPEGKFILHGGDPGALSAEELDDTLGTARDSLGDVSMRSAVEVSGVGITSQKLDVFLDYGTKVGISLDGDRHANRHRILKSGKPSFDKVMATIQLINQPRYRHLFAGIIGVANPESDPDETYEFFKKLLVPDGRARKKIDDLPWLSLVMPLGHYTQPPYTDEAHRASRPYGAWLAHMDERWMTSEDRHLFRLKETVALSGKVSGRQINSDFLGGDTLEDMTILSDGSYALRDTLSISSDGITVLDANVFEHSIEEAVVLRRQYMQRLGALTLSPICQTQCNPATRAICEGGTLAARYDERKTEAPFTNPAVTCGDLEHRIVRMLTLRARLQLDREHGRHVMPLQDIAYSADS